MLALTILSIFILIIVIIIFIEYRNEKKYQTKRREKTTQKKYEPNKLVVRKAPPKSKVEPEPKPEVKPKPEPELKIDVKPKTKPEVKVEAPEPKPELKPEPKIEIKPEPKPEPKVEAPEPIETKKLPEANYPDFTHIRLIEMGLSDDEAKEFVADLISQLETEIPLLDAAMKEGDFHKMERLTHGIKGSSSNLGTGGVSDLLTEYNTYLRTGTDIDIAKAYLEHLIHYTNELKVQYA